MTIVLLIGSALALLWAVTMLTSLGQAVYAYSFFFTDYFAGVVALVALSLTVMMGLLATDRLVLQIPHRVLLQSAHRATGIIGVAGLVFHVITKIAIGRAGPTDVLVPFVGGRGLYVGLGTVASFMMVSVLWTGLIRARFAGTGPKWLWRALHSTAYVSWPFALIHGLNAGRPAATWVNLSYLVCVLLVVVALFVRLSVTLGKRSREQSQAAALNKAMAGKPVDQGIGRSLLGNLTGRRGDSAEKEESRSGRGRGTRANGWAETTTGGWATAPGARRGDPDRFTVPVVPEPGTLREPVRPGRRRDEEPARRRRDEDDLAPAARRDDERPTRRRRDEAEVEVTSRRSRPRVEARSRYSAPPATADGPEEPWDSPRRWESADPVSAAPVDPVSAGPREPISSAPRSDGGSLAPRSGGGALAPRSGGGRHSAEDEVPDEVPDYWRPPGRYVADDLPVDDTPTLVDLASRRARRAAGDNRSKGRRRATADAVDGAYWAGLRGEAK
ncbi:ferric reductase-like transmembrane domain-containing protein [Micromonospora rosaria]|nr:ferric reductase-like transmembrane domain-containing protein [Micromonospora rosaria]